MSAWDDLNVCTCTPLMRTERRRCAGCLADDAEFAGVDAADLPSEIAAIEEAHVFPDEDAIGHEAVDCVCERTRNGIVVLHHRLDTTGEP